MSLTLASGREVATAKRIFAGLADERKDGACVGAMMKCALNNDDAAAALALFRKYGDAVVGAQGVREAQER